MPGARPESSGPVCAVTAWRASTRRVGACAEPSERPLRFAVVRAARFVIDVDATGAFSEPGGGVACVGT